MQTFKLRNGLEVIYEKKPFESVCINVMAKVGSNFEPIDVSGISHFTEHMLFEGTKKRTALEISNAIESKGGLINAATSNERTYYYIKILKKHFLLALDILSDIVFNPLFDKKLIDKERNVVLQEIDMVNDEPKYYQWVLFQKSLFESNIKNPTYGTKESVRSMSREDFMFFHNTYYVPNNIVITIVGNLPFSVVKREVSRYFNAPKPRPVPKLILKEPKQTVSKDIVEKKDIAQSNLIIGFKSPRRIEKESYVFDIVDAVLARGQSGKLFDTLRNKHGLAYDVGIYHDPSLHSGFFSAYVGTSPDKYTLAKDLILKEFDNLQSLKDSELSDAKSFIEGNFKLQQEESERLTELMMSWSYTSSLKCFKSYLKDINSVSLKEFKKTAKSYFSGNFCYTSLVPK